MTKSKDFTNEWFNSNIPLWEQFLSPLNGNEIHALEIGSFEGRSAVWLLENVLTHPKSTITCVDSYKEYDEMEQYKYDWEAVKNRFVNNTLEWKDKVILKVEESTNFLKNCEAKFDLIYIDGNHYSFQVLIDVVLAHLLLKRRGLIIFDDYLYGGLGVSPLVPKGAIDAFMTCFFQFYEPISMGYQIILRKK